jgi:hypothetical protein
MIPDKPLPYSDKFQSAEAYTDALLKFTTTSSTWQILCGGVHILDFFTSEPGLFYTALPIDWQDFLISCEPVVLLDLLMRDDLDKLENFPVTKPPDSLIGYIRDVRDLSLDRTFTPSNEKLAPLKRAVSVGMNVKKIHEVTNFAQYIHRLADDIAQTYEHEITHLVDFGSGQNYLGRALASAPYNRHVVAVEGREHNIAGAKELDVMSGLASKPLVMRNKKLWMQKVDSETPEDKLNEKARNRLAKARPIPPDAIVGDIRPVKELEVMYDRVEGKGTVQYVAGRLENGDLSDVIPKIEYTNLQEDEKKELKLMAVSIHSCGNLSHFGIRSLIINPAIHAVAIVGCCYNLVTEKLGPPSYKHPFIRPSIQPLNGRVVRESERRDPQGFPMSDKVSTYEDCGIRLNITARMMACQAPMNWTEKESDAFFTRHFFRAVLQKVFLDKGVIGKVHHRRDGDQEENENDGRKETEDNPFNMSTNPVIIGSLRKRHYESLNAYIKGAVNKLVTNSDFSQYSAIMKEKMADITDDEIGLYESMYGKRKRELSATWSLMAFSACVVESLMVTDRWTFLKEQKDLVKDCWVESVFDYKESPRNLVVVGIKK